MPFSRTLFALPFLCFFCGANRGRGDLILYGCYFPHAVWSASEKLGALCKIYAYFAVFIGGSDDSLLPQYGRLPGTYTTPAFWRPETRDYAGIHLHRFLLGGEALNLLLLVLLFYIPCHQMTALVSSGDQHSMADRSLIWYSLLEVRTRPFMFRLVVRLFSISRFRWRASMVRMAVFREMQQTLAIVW